MGTTFRSVVCLVLAAVLVAICQAYQSFQDQIPNGNKVPHPCKANYMWPGVGHENRLGGGFRNVFGRDFKESGYWWSEELCRKDSDGDGWSNGYELGDPDCQWGTDQIPARTSNISHPGICDPHNSPQCKGKNDFVDCELEEFYCPRLNKTDVKHLDMRFLETEIPNTETNYYCMTFDLPEDQDYHVIATEPIMDNMEVLHHILVYACDGDNGTSIPKPRSCGMEVDSEGRCDTIIGLWTVGNPGICYTEGIGYRIGKTSYKRVKLEIHYNNPMEKSGLKDKSGIRLYIQPEKPDVQDLVTLSLGTPLFEIPPRQSRVTVDSVCKADCTRSMLVKPAKIFAAINHMHYMGVAMSIELFRDGVKVADITSDSVYSYDSPVIHTHTPSLDLLPGDEIKTSCVYSSINTQHYVGYGDATSDEMCFGFAFVYPKDALSRDNCYTFDKMDICDLFSGKHIDTPMGKCDWGAFTHFGDGYIPPWTNRVDKNCGNDGYCRPMCKEIVKNMMDQEPCMHKEASTIVNWRLSASKEGRSILAKMNGCRGALMDDKHCPDAGDDHKDGHHHGQCGWEECKDYCPATGGHGPYDAAPKMAASWLTAVLASLVMAVYSLY